MKDRWAQFWTDHRNDVWLAIGVTLVTFISFGLGLLFLPSSKPSQIRVEDLPATVSEPMSSSNSTDRPIEGKYVASKNGSKYYLPTCPGASRIKEENRVWFTSEEEALDLGFTPSKDCFKSPKINEKEGFKTFVFRVPLLSKGESRSNKVITVETIGS